ncbi:MAG: CBS domain-containing protein [Methanotrichaceae archaeon]|nr:CBS domain-containing protein [Methanotrichaceae archaeon]
MLVEDIMSRDPLYIEDSTFLTKARQLIRDYHVRGLPVVNSKKHVIGIITTQDVLRVTSTRSNVTVAGFITNVPLITDDMEMLDAARLMLREKSNLLPVVKVEDNPELVGVVSLFDIFKNIDLKKVPDKKICDIMSTKVLTANPDDPLTKVWDKMVNEDFTGLPVIGNEGKPIGMITKFDILKRGWARIGRESDTRPTEMPVQKLMSTPVYFVDSDQNMIEAIRMMLKRDIGRITVMDEGKIVGIVDRYDLIKSYLNE